MTQHSHTNTQGAVDTFLQILRERRSRRFGLGMKMASGPMAFQAAAPVSRYPRRKRRIGLCSMRRDRLCPGGPDG